MVQFNSDKFKYSYASEALRMRTLVLCVMFILIVVQLSLAIGVARPTFSNDRMEISANENDTIFFQLQNGESSQKTVLFRVVIQFPAMIKDADESNYVGNAIVFQKQYILPAKSTVPVNINVIAPNGLYRLDYSYSEASTGNGTVRFDTTISDSFFVKAGTGSPNYVLGISLDYPGYSLDTSANSLKFVNDLVINSDYIDIDYSGQTIDLTGFQGNYIIFGTKNVTVDSSSFPALNAPAKLIFSNVNSSYQILRNGVICPSSICSVISYSSRRLTFSVTGFSSYEVIDVVNASVPVTSTTTTKTTTSSSSGTIPININATKNTTSGVPVVKPTGNNQPSQASSSGSAVSTPQVSQNDKKELIAPTPVKSESIVTSLNPSKDKKSVLIAVFAAIGMMNLIMAIVLVKHNNTVVEEEK